MANNDDVQVTWLGHSTFHFVSPKGKTILVDPWLKQNPSCPDKYKDGFDQLDYMLITHGHGDHFGDAIPVVKKCQPTVIAMFELILYLSKHGMENMLPLNKGGTVLLPGSETIKVTAVHADHSSTIEDGDNILLGGEPIGFIIKFENAFTIYFAGDTAVFGDMKIIADLYHPDLVILPIGDTYTMGPKEAAYAVKLLGASRVIPMHYGSLPELTGTPDKLKTELVSYNVEIMTPVAGETFTLSKSK